MALLASRGLRRSGRPGMGASAPLALSWHAVRRALRPRQPPAGFQTPWRTTGPASMRLYTIQRQGEGQPASEPDAAAAAPFKADPEPHEPAPHEGDPQGASSLDVAMHGESHHGHTPGEAAAHQLQHRAAEKLSFKVMEKVRGACCGQWGMA